MLWNWALLCSEAAGGSENDVLRQDTGDALIDLGIIRSPEDQKRRDEGETVITCLYVMTHFKYQTSNYD